MSLLGGVLDFAGGLIGGRQREKSTEGMHRENIAMQREFAQHGVRWKVEDAKAAGLHPLFALGGSTSSFSPTVAVGDHAGGLGDALSKAGQNISRAVAAQETPEQREQRQMALAVQRSQISENDARAAYYTAEAAKAAQEARATKPFPVSAPVSTADLNARPYTGRVEVKPDEVISSRGDDRSLTAGTHPAFQEYTLTPHGVKMRLPRSDEGPGEAMENVPWYLWPAMVAHNLSYYGPDWGKRFIKEFVFDKPPVYRTTDPRSSRLYGGPARQRVTGRIVGR